MDTLKAVPRGTVISHLSRRRKKKSVTEAARIGGRLEIARKRSLKQPTKANLRKIANCLGDTELKSSQESTEAITVLPKTVFI